MFNNKRIGKLEKKVQIISDVVDEMAKIMIRNELKKLEEKIIKNKVKKHVNSKQK